MLSEETNNLDYRKKAANCLEDLNRLCKKEDLPGSRFCSSAWAGDCTVFEVILLKQIVFLLASTLPV